MSPKETPGNPSHVLLRELKHFATSTTLVFLVSATSGVFINTRAAGSCQWQARYTTKFCASSTIKTLSWLLQTNGSVRRLMVQDVEIDPLYTEFTHAKRKNVINPAPYARTSGLAGSYTYPPMKRFHAGPRCPCLRLLGAFLQKEGDCP